MLSKNKRLNLSFDFEWVRSGKSIKGEHFTLFVRLGDNLSPRVGVAISSKQFPKAVARNRVKRILYEVFGNLYDRLPANSNIIALPKAGIDKVESEDLSKEVYEKVSNIFNKFL